MAASIEDFTQVYQQALTAYAQQNYQEAASLIDTVVANIPDDPNTHLLRGHIYYVLQKYDIAKSEYQRVLDLTDDPEIMSFAKNGLDNVSQYQANAYEVDTDTMLPEGAIASGESISLFAEDDDLPSLSEINSSFDLSSLGAAISPEATGDGSMATPFDAPSDTTIFAASANTQFNLGSGDNPFTVSPGTLDGEDSPEDGELPPFWQDANHPDGADVSSIPTDSPFQPLSATPSPETDAPTDGDDSMGELELPSAFFSDTDGDSQADTSNRRDLSFNFQTLGDSLDDETLLNNVPPNSTIMGNSNYASDTSTDMPESVTGGRKSPGEFSTFSIEMSASTTPSANSTSANNGHVTSDDAFDFEAFESAFGLDNSSFGNFSDNDNSPSQDLSEGSMGATPSPTTSIDNQNNIEFLDDFDEFDDLGNIPGFDLSNSSYEADSQLNSGQLFHQPDLQSASLHSTGYRTSSTSKSTENTQSKSKLGHTDGVGSSTPRDEELFSITSPHDAVPIFSQPDISRVQPQVSGEQGVFAPLENASLDQKHWFMAGAVGIASMVMAALVSYGVSTFSPPQQRVVVRNTGWAMALAAGIAGGATAGVMGSLTFRQIRRTTKDLQTQFDLVRQGNLNVQATVYSEDEFGQLAAGFNEMARVILTTTSEATRKAHEQEEAKENLQRQVIRLLDDVEGAARGDLTVQAEVTADVLGAVADAFNLTIQNLRDIVQQVKVAAREVTKGATNSETFARALSSDALRQAEELAVTLNSVQIMTDSIQRVAEAAREAEIVARDASDIAVKGGEAVENTVAGILEIRETVAETTRKVKRLAESSQEISKIVALISQIASRTNLLALNASIEAARAGEAGRGFAIVADEVRQLADKSAKSLKEIEQIVMQIQSETGSVMTAMEEGTQQVIKGTKLAEEAKRSLDNIIQVAKRIDILVCSITADTVDQTETSRAVAQVMQSVELTAQETSQEAQRVSGALQNLVGVSRDLIASVERFRVETAETR